MVIFTNNNATLFGINNISKDTLFGNTNTNNNAIKLGYINSKNNSTKAGPYLAIIMELSLLVMLIIIKIIIELICLVIILIILKIPSILKKK